MTTRRWFTLAAVAIGSAVGALGVLLAALGLLVQALLPMIGYLVFRARPSGVYTPTDYAIDLGAYYAIAIGCVVGGFLVASLLTWRAWQSPA